MTSRFTLWARRLPAAAALTLCALGANRPRKTAPITHRRTRTRTHTHTHTHTHTGRCNIGGGSLALLWRRSNSGGPGVPARGWYVRPGGLRPHS